jgi:hypothetical protein
MLSHLPKFQILKNLAGHAGAATLPLGGAGTRGLGIPVPLPPRRCPSKLVTKFDITYGEGVKEPHNALCPTPSAPQG